jgi:hypothetical protein
MGSLGQSLTMRHSRFQLCCLHDREEGQRQEIGGQSQAGLNRRALPVLRRGRAFAGRMTTGGASDLVR